MNVHAISKSNHLNTILNWIMLIILSYHINGVLYNTIKTLYRILML